MSGIASGARRLPGSSRRTVCHRCHSARPHGRRFCGRTGGADFFTTEVWTWRGLVTYYTLFVIDLASRHIQIVGSTPYSDALFMRQVGRTLTAAEDGLLRDHRVLIYDRDRKWSRDVRQLIEDEGIVDQSL